MRCPDDCPVARKPAGCGYWINRLPCAHPKFRYMIEQKGQREDNMKTFILAKRGQSLPEGRTSIHAILKSSHNTITDVSYALIKHLRENDIPFSVRHERTRRGDELIFSFNNVEYVVREPSGAWEYLVLQKDWFGIPTWTLTEPIAETHQQSSAAQHEFPAGQ